MRRAPATLAVLFLALAAAAPAVAQPTTQERLDNGLLVLVRENPLAPVVAITLMIEMGTRWETPENSGISNFVHAVMVKGTKKRGGGEMAEAVAKLGGKIGASGDVTASCPDEPRWIDSTTPSSHSASHRGFQCGSWKLGKPSVEGFSVNVSE